MLRGAAKAIARQIPPIGRLIRLIRQPPRDRRDVILRNLDLDGLGLEIGPSHNPLLPKSQGYRVETIDHADANHLREKYRALGQDVGRIEEVDYVSGGGSIFETIGKPGRYDYIVASHVIEHIPDILGFLQDCERLLKPNGHVSLAVPDKRYCFDVFQALSTTGQVLQAHIDHASRPDPGTIFDHFANCANRGGQITWPVESKEKPCFIHDLTKAAELYEKGRSGTEYLDAHIWRFVPSSFRLIINDLNTLKEISLRELSFMVPGGFEFFVTLSRGGPGCRHDRLTLARQALSEHAAVAS